MIKIMICCHKACNFPQDEIYLPIQVGKECTEVELGIQSDNSLNGEICDNISALNNIYCEMTGMYWAWKNIKKLYPNITYIGLCHYRRFFYVDENRIMDSTKYYLKKVRTMIKIAIGKPVELCIHDPIICVNGFEDLKFRKNTSLLKTIIPRYEMIYTKPVQCCVDVNTYFSVIGRTYIEILEKIISDEYKQYEPAFKNVLVSNRIYAANMLILKIEYLDEYCSFVFGVLDKHIKYVKEKIICINPENEKIYSRVSGYLAEILTSTYIVCMKNKRKSIGLGKIFVNE